MGQFLQPPSLPGARVPLGLRSSTGPVPGDHGLSEVAREVVGGDVVAGVQVEPVRRIALRAHAGI